MNLPSNGTWRQVSIVIGVLLAAISMFFFLIRPALDVSELRSKTEILSQRADRNAEKIGENSAAQRSLEDRIGKQLDELKEGQKEMNRRLMELGDRIKNR